MTKLLAVVQKFWNDNIIDGFTLQTLQILIMFPPLLKPHEKTYLRIKVTTKQPKTEYLSTLDDGTIKIRLKAVPEKGRANEELIRFLAEVFSIQKDTIEIIAGATDTVKLVRIG